MSKHTPGPWRAERWMEDAPSARLFGPHGEIVARFFCVRGEEVENLELATAAPEMLEALSGLVSAIEAIRSDLGTDYPALAEAWVRGRVAINKAEGR